MINYFYCKNIECPSFSSCISGFLLMLCDFIKNILATYYIITNQQYLIFFYQERRQLLTNMTPLSFRIMISLIYFQKYYYLFMMKCILNIICISNISFFFTCLFSLHHWLVRSLCAPSSSIPVYTHSFNSRFLFLLKSAYNHTRLDQ